jgi:hypothetical protein
MRAAIRVVTALAVLAVCVALLVACSKHEAAPTGLLPFMMRSAPVAESPADAIRRLQKSWATRDVDLYATVLTADYCFQCSVRDSAGSGSRASGCAFGRDDELQFARHFFETGSATDPPATDIAFDLTSDLVAVPDARPGKDPGWHSQIRAQVFFRFNIGDSGFIELKGPSLFYLVRGDSASIPPELVARGFAPDPNRWYVERWEDETSAESDLAADAGPTRPLPTPSFSLCALKERYR